MRLVRLARCLLALVVPAGLSAQAVELQVAPPRMTLSPGQRAVVTVTAYDAAGNVVETPAVKWVSGDAGVVTVSVDSAHPDVATLVGVAAGVTTVEAHLGQLSNAMAVQTLAEGEAATTPAPTAPTEGAKTDERTATIRASYDAGNAAAAANRPDSAIAHYRRFLAQADDPAYRQVKGVQGMRETAIFNLANQYYRARQWDSAAKYFGRLRDMRPGDAAVANRLAGVMEATGRSADALTLYDSVLAHPDSMSSRELFTAGVGLLRGKRYREAARAFEAGLSSNACAHDALFNLANAITGLAESAGEPAGRPGRAGRGRGALAARRREIGDSILSIGHRLVDLAPLGRGGFHVLASGYQHLGMADSARAAVAKVRDMPLDVRVTAFAAFARRATVSGTINNLTNQAVQSPALTFEFVDGHCGVLATGQVAGRSVPANGASPFAVNAQAAGITAWKYTAGN